MTTLLESKARPFGSSKGVMFSMVLHGAIIAAVVIGTAATVLPPREKVEEHPVLYVASPPPPPVKVAPEPLKVARPKVAPKAQPAPKRFEPPRPRPVAVAPPKLAPTPALVAPVKIAVSLPAIDPGAKPTLTDVIAPPTQEPTRSASGSGSGSVKGTSDGDVGDRGGLSSGNSGKAFSEDQVDRAVQILRPSPPRYPEALRSVNVEGSVQVRFIVSAEGKVEPGSIEVISTAHKLFAEAVKNALLNTRFRPAEAAGHPVRQLVEQSFGFKLDK